MKVVALILCCLLLAGCSALEGLSGSSGSTKSDSDEISLSPEEYRQILDDTALAIINSAA